MPPKKCLVCQMPIGNFNRLKSHFIRKHSKTELAKVLLKCYMLIKTSQTEPSRGRSKKSIDTKSQEDTPGVVRRMSCRVRKQSTRISDCENFLISDKIKREHEESTVENVESVEQKDIVNASSAIEDRSDIDEDLIVKKEIVIETECCSVGTPHSSETKSANSIENSCLTADENDNIYFGDLGIFSHYYKPPESEFDRDESLKVKSELGIEPLNLTDCSVQKLMKEDWGARKRCFSGDPSFLRVAESLIKVDVKETCGSASKLNQSSSDTESSSEVDRPKASTSQLYLCHLCSNAYSNKLKLMQHSAMHSIRCNFCSKQCLMGEDYNNHVESHFMRIYVCHYCKQEFGQKHILLQHLESHLENDIYNDILGLEEDYKITAFKRSFDYYTPTQTMVNQYYNERPNLYHKYNFTCDYCHVTYCSFNDYQLHLRMHFTN